MAADPISSFPGRTPRRWFRRRLRNAWIQGRLSVTPASFGNRLASARNRSSRASIGKPGLDQVQHGEFAGVLRPAGLPAEARPDFKYPHGLFQARSKLRSRQYKWGASIGRRQ